MLDLLGARITELEGALAVFVDDRNDSGCLDCLFWSGYDGYEKCEIDDEAARPCEIGWETWAVAEGKRRIRDYVQIQIRPADSAKENISPTIPQ